MLNYDFNQLYGFKMAFKEFLVISSSFFLSSCASTLVSDDRLRTSTAFELGVQPDKLSVSNRKVMRNGVIEITRYGVALSNGKKYKCSVEGGNFLMMGSLATPVCKSN